MRAAIQHTTCLARIIALPRRRLDFAQASERAARLTRLLAIDPRAHLRPWQGQILHEVIDALEHPGRGVYAGAPVGLGKAQPNTEPVLTPSGWCPIGSLTPGDEVIGSRGLPVRVLSVHPQGERDLARLTFSDGSDALCDWDHLWTLYSQDRGPRTRTAREWATTRLERPCGEHRAKIWWLPPHPRVEGAPAELPLDPYTLGALLGDGCLRAGSTPSFTSMDPDIVARLRFPGDVYARETASTSAGRASTYSLRARHIRHRADGPPVENPLVTVLRELGCHGHLAQDKRVPEQYLRAGADQREELLAGLLDTDGSVMPAGAAEFCSMSEALALAVVELAQSLGATATRVMNRSAAFRTVLRFPADVRPFRCMRKAMAYAASLARRQRIPKRYLVRIDPAGRAECTCIHVDAQDSLYLTREHILTHNTLLAWLVPVITDAQRPVLVIPGGLRPDVQGMFRSYVGTWTQCPGGIRIITLEELARAENEGLLEALAPDCVIVDEVDTVRNHKAAAPKRLTRYRIAHPEARFYAWTGSPGRLSVCDMHHPLVWCLGEGAPVPLRRGEAAHWGQVIDPATSAYRVRARPDAGALELLGGGTTEDGVREAFRARLHETPGVIIVDGDTCDQPLTIAMRTVPANPAMDRHWYTFRTEHVTPDGWPTSDALSVYRHAGELGCELFLRWNPRPPMTWLQPYREFCAFVRDRVEDDDGDTMAAVVARYPEAPEVLAWRAVEDTFTPNSEPVWLGDTVLKACAAWFREDPRPSAFWTWTVAFGEALSALTGLRYFGAGGYDRNGVHISSVPGYNDANAKGVPNIILSGQANLRGRNLQGWTRHAGIQFPRSARFLEQWFGRAHRQGQTRPVHVDLFMTSGDSFDGFEATLREARFGRQVFGLTQKLLRAQVVRTRIPEGSPYRWAVKPATRDAFAIAHEGERTHANPIQPTSKWPAGRRA